MKQIIGLTGPSGSGKSTAVKTASDFGITVVDCDKAVHNIFRTDAECKAALCREFGDKILENGEINRRTLAALAFENAAATQLLNNTVFPYVIYHILKLIDASGGNIILLDAPTLFESGIDELCGTTVAVLADRSLRLERIIKRDGLDKAQALHRINAGKTDDFYKTRADYILTNNGDPAELEREFNSLLCQLSTAGGNNDEH